MKKQLSMSDRVVITGVGMITSVGNDRESSWLAVRSGQSGVRRMTGLIGIPDEKLLGASVEGLDVEAGETRYAPLAMHAAEEALRDSELELRTVDHERFACGITANVGDTPRIAGKRTESLPSGSFDPWWTRFLPNSTCAHIARRFALHGPRLCHSAACASGTVATLRAYYAIQDDQCDLALVGSAQMIHPLLAAGFHSMRVLAHHDDPAQACRPFDINRSGFVMGEGAAMLVLERLSHAQQRRAPIYAEIVGGQILCEAHHVTGLDSSSQTLYQLIDATLRKSGLGPSDISYINAHGTGTKQNDAMETRGIRAALGQAANSVCVSSTKSMLGHLLNAAGSVELAITTMALRDGFAPPTLNLTDPDPDCDLDCIPLVGRSQKFEHAMKLSIAFGGHLAAVTLRRWSGAGERHEYHPLQRAA
jgi:3-oxoacyl-(acyl-carrier-protein) synthase